MFTDQRLYRARALEPLGALGDVLYIIDNSGPVTASDGPFFAIVGSEPVEGLGPHGLFPIWSQGAAAIAGYGTAPGNTNLPAGTPTGSIVNGTFAEFNNPTALQQAKKQLLHCRFNLKFSALTGVVTHDMELQVFMPAAAGKFGINAISPGFINAANQFGDAADQIVTPAQGAQQAVPTFAPAVHPRDDAGSREMFIFELNGPKFRLWNNGSASLTAGMAFLRIWGFRYDLFPLYDDGSWVNRWVHGRIRRAPPSDSRIIVVPTAPFGATGSY